MRQTLIKTLCLAAVLLPLALPTAHARMADQAQPGAVPGERTPHATTQQGKTLSQAIEQVRRQGNVERIIKAETRTSGGCEVHYIRYQTKDGKVRTQQVRGRCQ